MLQEASRARWLDALEGDAGSVCGVNCPREDAGLTAVVGMESDGLVSGDSPETDPDCLLLEYEGVIWALGVTALRPDILFERHRSLVKSMTSPAPIASKAPE